VDLRRGLLLLIVAGAVLRLATLGLQSYEADEAVTVSLLRLDLSGLWHAIPDSESTPPLYYLVAKLLGPRLPSALAGIGLIGVAYGLTRRLASERAALLAAALVAVNPFLFWFSQEARSYALVALLCGISLWAFVSRSLAVWAVSSAAALATHYFAVFPVAVEAAWLLWTGPRDRRLLASLVGVGAASAALAPLALHQRDNAGFAPLLDSGGSLATRVAQIPKQFLLGYDAPAELVLGLAAVALVAAAASLGWRTRPAVVGAAAVALPLALAVAGSDVLVARNVIAALLPLLVLVAIGAARQPLLGAGLLALFAVALLAQLVEPSYQRDDWRGAVRALGHAAVPRLVVIEGPGTVTTLQAYRDVRPANDETVAEVDVITMAERSRLGAREVPSSSVAPPGFSPAGTTDGSTYVIHRFRAPSPTGISGLAPADQVALLPADRPG
jgi:mannosyltransferase